MGTLPPLWLALVMCSIAWQAQAGIDIKLENTIEVYTGASVEIPCFYNFTNKPKVFMVQWFVLNSEGRRTRIFYRDYTMHSIDKNTNYTGRIDFKYNNSGEMLTIHNIQLSDERPYFCEVSGFSEGFGVLKTFLRVYDEFDPPVIKGVKDPVLLWMKSKIASCETRNGYPTPNITWYRDHMKILDADVVTVSTREPSGLYTMISDLYYNVTLKDKNVHFFCEVQYDVPGNVKTLMSNAIKINFQYLDQAVVVPNDVIMLKGESLTARCDAVSSVETSTVWLKDGVEVEKGAILHIENATLDTAGQYYCEVTVPSDPRLESNASVHLSVLDPTPVDWGMKKTIEVKVGESVEIPCFYNFAKNFSQPQLFRMYWSVVTPETTRVWISYSNATVQHILPNTTYEDRVSVQLSEGVAKLTIHKVQLSDEREFHCNIMADQTGESKTYLKIHRVNIVVIMAPMIVGIFLLTILLLVLNETGILRCRRTGKLEVANEMGEVDDFGVAEVTEQLETSDVEITPSAEQDNIFQLYHTCECDQ